MISSSSPVSALIILIILVAIIIDVNVNINIYKQKPTWWVIDYTNLPLFTTQHALQLKASLYISERESESKSAFKGEADANFSKLR